MIGILDVSGAIEILLQKAKAVKFRKAMEESSLVLAPDLYISELTNAFWKYFTAKLYTERECEEYIRLGIGYVDEFIDSKEIWLEALVQGVKNGHSVYDMFYMITARRNGGIMITNDSVLAGICKKNHVQICF